MPVFKDLTGQRFGRLVAKRFLGNRIWECECDCGNLARVQNNNLQTRQLSCGCLRNEMTKTRSLTHGETVGRSPTPEYRAWQSMIKRCYYKKSRRWERYGGRGIGVCKEWKEDFASFLDAVGRRPTRRHSLDRIDNDGDYKPGNVRWATKSEQAKNQSRNAIYVFHGKSYCLSDLVEFSGVGLSTIQTRLRLGWSVEEAVTSPRTNKWKRSATRC